MFSAIPLIPLPSFERKSAWYYYHRRKKNNIITAAKPIKKRILGSDSWTEGSVTYGPVASAFKDSGHELLLIHVGSWGHDTGRPQEEKIGDMLVRDISYYSKPSIIDILNKKNSKLLFFYQLVP